MAEIIKWSNCNGELPSQLPIKTAFKLRIYWICQFFDYLFLWEIINISNDLFWVAYHSSMVDKPPQYSALHLIPVPFTRHWIWVFPLVFDASIGVLVSAMEVAERSCFGWRGTSLAFNFSCTSKSSSSPTIKRMIDFIDLYAVPFGKNAWNILFASNIHQWNFKSYQHK